MINGLFRLIGYLVILAIVSFVLTGVWIVYDGLHDKADHADVGLVPGYAEIKDGALAPELQARLDRAAALYGAGKIPFIIVSGVTPPNETDESDAMAQYLEAHQVPGGAVIEEHRGENAKESLEGLTKIMKEQRFRSVMLINTYYLLTRMKLVLRHAGIENIEQAHAGEWKKEDAQAVVREDIKIYDHLNTWYLLPAEKNIKEKVMGWKTEIDDGLKPGTK